MFEEMFSGVGALLDNAVSFFLLFPLWLKILIIVVFLFSFLCFIMSRRTHRIDTGYY
jgi:hypothetical protein